MGITDRIDAITSIPLRYRNSYLPAPKSCKIEITSSCNYKCQFCVKSIQPENAQMDRKLYRRLLREMRDYGVEELGVFYIGESFTCGWLPDAIKEAKDIGFPYVFLTTNGSIATPERVEKCMAAGLDSLKFSINFYDAGQLHEIARVTSRFWSKAIENLKEARRIRDACEFNCGIYASAIAFDGDQGKKMRAVVDNIRSYVDEFYWLPLYGMSGAAKEAGMKPSPGNPGRLDAMRPPLPCWAVFTEAHITASGKLAACCFGTGSDKDLVMADLTKVSFSEGWNSDEFRALRRAHLDKDVSKTGCAECIQC